MRRRPRPREYSAHDSYDSDESHYSYESDDSNQSDDFDDSDQSDDLNESEDLNQSDDLNESVESCDHGESYESGGSRQCRVRTSSMSGGGVAKIKHAQPPERRPVDGYGISYTTILSAMPRSAASFRIGRIDSFSRMAATPGASITGPVMWISCAVDRLCTRAAMLTVWPK